MRLGYFLDVHATFGGVDDDVFTRRTVEQHAHVVLFGGAFAGVVHILGDEHFVDQATFGAGLLGHELHAQDLASDVFYLLQVFGELYSTAFAPAASMNLGLNDIPAGAGLLGEGFGGFYGFVGRVGSDAFLDAHAVFLQDFLALILVNIHLTGRWGTKL